MISPGQTHVNVFVRFPRHVIPRGAAATRGISDLQSMFRQPRSLKSLLLPSGWRIFWSHAIALMIFREIISTSYKSQPSPCSC